MKILVMGSGGIGGYFGARLAEAGNDVTFVARGAHLAAMQTDGLRIESPLGNLHLQPTRAVPQAKDAQRPDPVIFSVKLGDTEEAAASMKPVLAAGVPIFSFQNGVESEQMIGRGVGEGHVVPGVARIAAHIAKPGVVVHGSPFARLEFAESDNKPSQRCEAFQAACRKAGIDAHIVPDIQRALWVKFAMLAPMSGVTTLTQRTAGPLRSNPATRGLIENAVREVVAVGDAAGGHLRASDIAAVMSSVDTLPEAMTTSMSHDRAAGKPLELNWLSGAVARLGDHYKVPTPTHHFIAQALALEAGGQKSRS